MPISVYVHIPFCKAKCNYCDFLSFYDKEPLYELYVDALCRDIYNSSKDLEDKQVQTIFFGGGTPTVLAYEHLGRIVETLKSLLTLSSAFNLSIEANPETVDLIYLENIKKIGFNRISFGVQSFDDKLLSRIGRIHSSNKAIKTIQSAKSAGFDDINIDLMFALPGQSLQDFANTLDTAISLAPTHISCYALTVEENTPLAQNKALMMALPDETLDRKMYYLAKDRLLRAGFIHYEISNWAKEGSICRHNLGYWTGREYIGFGAGAHSFINKQRYSKTNKIDEYILGDFSGHNIETITDFSEISEFVFLGLRLINGIDTIEFEKRFNKNIFSVFGEKFLNLSKQGLLIIDENIIRLTAYGIDLSNQVFSEFI